MPKGFTLIELLIVIVVLGVLATVVLVAINPLGMINSANLAKAKTFAASVENLLSISQVGKWSFESVVANKTPDTSGYGNDGTLTNGPTWQIASTCDLGFGRCLGFGGVNSYVNAGNGASLKVTNGFTIVAWIRKSDQTSSMSLIVGKEADQNSPGYSVALRNNDGRGTIRFSVNGILNDSDGGGIWTDNNWHHLAVSYDNQIAKWYNDGRLIRSTTINSPIGDNNENFKIGGNVGGTNYFNGTIDEVAIYNQALLFSQIRSLYTQGLAKHQLVSS